MRKLVLYCKMLAIFFVIITFALTVSIQSTQRDRKRRLIGAVCRNHRIKRVVPCRCLDGHIKEPYEMSMALGARP